MKHRYPTRYRIELYKEDCENNLLGGPGEIRTPVLMFSPTVELQPFVYVHLYPARPVLPRTDRTCRSILHHLVFKPGTKKPYGIHDLG